MTEIVQKNIMKTNGNTINVARVNYKLKLLNLIIIHILLL